MDVSYYVFGRRSVTPIIHNFRLCIIGIVRIMYKTVIYIIGIGIMYNSYYTKLAP